ncbi:hypothetical protein V6N11_023776 [Hibiscus sabdariffa]|uniref:STI1 domain-containing protein n=1 Tax=Hibiscus sabdariffa TaxID=183260 RepID=A0ABR2TNA3_9ROSI
MALVSSFSVSSASKFFQLGYNNPNHTLKNPTKTFHFRTSKIAPRRSPIPISAHASPLPPRHPRIAVLRKDGDERFASISSSSSSNQLTTSVGVNPNPTVPPPTSQIGSPLFWIGVGVGLSALFTWNYAMQQAFKTMMGQMNTQNNQFNDTAFPPGSPFPFPAPPSAGPATPRSPSSQPAVTVDASASKIEATSVTYPTTEVKSVKNETETAETKKYAFVDVSPEEAVNKSAFEDAELSSSNDVGSPKDISDNGAASKQDADAFTGFQASGSAGPTLSVDALEKMLEDPTVQKMVYPYLPEEMRNPETFKWMLQNPQYRQQLQDMLNNMGGNTEWDNTMMESLKNFDLNSPEVKQQFDQIGLTPEEVISKIMANPEVAMAFQNPRVQAAIMECSQNPLSIAKYQNDKEVMDVFNKISELFPGVSGSPGSW